jgi:hypothetical protein
MKNRFGSIGFTLLSGLACALAILFILGRLSGPAAAGTNAPQGEMHVCLTGCPYSSIQAAVDAATSGDVIKVAAGVYSGVSARNNITQSVYINKSTTVQGGYTPSNWTSPDPEANRTTIDAQGKGRVLYVDLHTQKKVVLDGLWLINGNATKGGGFVRAGGGLYALGWDQTSAITLTNNHIIGNSAYVAGAGMEVWAMAVTLIDNTIASNDLQKGGGAELAQGGGVYLSNAAGRLVDNLIMSNTVPIDAYYGDGGGGFYADYSTVYLSGNTFIGNEANEGGGLSVMRTPLTLVGNQFISNKASLGGGIYYGADNDSSSVITMTGNTLRGNQAGDGAGAWLLPFKGTASHNFISDNAAENEGGGLIVGGGNFVLQANRIISNTASGRGGGLSLSSSPLVSGNIIIGNTSVKGGGVSIAVLGQSSPLLINNVIADNRVHASGDKTGEGSAVYIENGTAHMAHATLRGNYGGDGSSVCISSTHGYNGTAILTNTIIANQAVGIKVRQGSSANINGVLWFNIPITLTAEASTSSSIQHQVKGNPKFAVDGYHILVGSAAIDKGVMAGIINDIDSQLRPNPIKPDGKPDLGADEWYPAIDKFIYLPFVARR